MEAIRTENYEKLYAMLLDAIPSSVLLIGSDMRIVTANRNFLEKSRRTPAETMGRRLEEVFPPAILDFMKLSDRVREVFESDRATRGDRLTYRAPGLGSRIYYCKLLPVSRDGLVELVMLLMDDVTEQVRLAEDVRRIERHLAGVVECASDIVLSTDTEGRIVSWNPAAERISGLQADEVRGRRLVQFCPKERVEEARRAFRTGEAEWPIARRDGTEVPVSWVFSPMKDDSGRPAGYVVIGRDLTERRKLEMQLVQSQKLAALGVMAGGIAHEIRNPLAICSSAAQFLSEERVPAAFRKECAEKINSGIRRASAIIENLLRIARPAEKAEMERVDLVAIVRETLALVENQAKIQQVRLEPRLPDGPVPLLGVGGLLQQLFLNLFVNAIHAMPEGGRLGVAVERTGSEARARVTDTGCGIPRGNLEKIFDPFFTTSPAGKGTGLGLSICYAIVKQHSGAIEVESEEGRGSAFTVRFPDGA